VLERVLPALLVRPLRRAALAREAAALLEADVLADEALLVVDGVVVAGGEAGQEVVEMLYEAVVVINEKKHGIILPIGRLLG